MIDGNEEIATVEPSPATTENDPELDTTEEEPVLFELDKFVAPFVADAANERGVELVTPDNHDVVLVGRGVCYLAEWHGLWEMHIDIPDAVQEYAIMLQASRNTGQSIAFQSSKRKAKMGAPHGEWWLEFGMLIINGEFNYNWPNNRDLISFRIYRKSKYVWEGVDGKHRSVRLTLKRRETFTRSSNYIKTSKFVEA